MDNQSTMELLAPVGGQDQLEAALAAGADAVYFGLTSLNARRGAQNFSPDALPQTVAAIHAAKAKAYLTLNIDIAERELGQAARALALAQEAGVDAVLVRDPALLLFSQFFPKLAFHLSTQGCAASSLDVVQAKEFGISRVVLARELTIGEIAAAAKVPGVEIEVFTQGALCFCVSGRCLLSSWGGGRSGNRGLCASPCRAPWSKNGDEAQSRFSMLDLSAIKQLPELAKAGVACIKIEGRLKNAAWVAEAVKLYKRALAGENPDTLWLEAERLGSYSGRRLTSGYLEGKRDALTGESFRPLSALSEGDAPTHYQSDADFAAGLVEQPSAESAVNANDDATVSDNSPQSSNYDLSITRGTKGLLCHASCSGREEEWQMPATVVRRAEKASSLAGIGEWLAEGLIQAHRLGTFKTDEPERLVPPKNLNALVVRLSAFLHRCKQKPAPSSIHAEIPTEVRALLDGRQRHKENKFALSGRPDRARIDAAQAMRFLQEVQGVFAIVENATPAQAAKLVERFKADRFALALPTVFFEPEIPAMRELSRLAVAAGVLLEANTWSGVALAKEVGAAYEAGPGLAVLNSLAAAFLKEKGACGVYATVEADRAQLEAMTEKCPASLSIITYGRPALAITRARVENAEIYEDRRAIRLMPVLRRGLAYLYAAEPFDLNGQRNTNIRASHYVADLVAATDAVAEWHCIGEPNRNRFRFNYDRELA